MENLELYVHIPFCQQKCYYCDFLSAYADKESQSAYMEALFEEIQYYGRQSSQMCVTSIFIGGGTPSLLHEVWIAKLMEYLTTYFYIEANAEITIECNPKTLTVEKLKTYQLSGINRLSIGLQSSNNQELKLLGRIHTYEDFLENYHLARNVGFTNINVDLMSGLPMQTLFGYEKTIRKVVELNPEHISAYSLIIEPGTPFYDTYKFDVVRQQAGIKPEMLPHEEVEYQITKMTQQVLLENGYERYEISNYAKKGYHCKHNQGYWNRVSYLGLGLGASSFYEEKRYKNISNLEDYIHLAKNIKEVKLVDEYSTKNAIGLNLHEQVIVLDKKAAMEEFLFLGLRQIKGIEKSDFYHQFHFSVHHIYENVIHELIADGYLEETTRRIFLTEKGLDVSNPVLSKFLLE